MDVADLVDALLAWQLTEPQATVLAMAGPEAVRLALFAANARIAGMQAVTPASVHAGRAETFRRVANSTSDRRSLTPGTFLR